MHTARLPSALYCVRRFFVTFVVLSVQFL